MARLLYQVIDKITDIAPDLEEPLRSARTSSLYAAPESLWVWWHEVSVILNSVAADHPKQEQIRSIFGGEEEVNEDND